MTIPELRRPRDGDDQNKIRPTAMVPSSEHLTQMDRGMSTTEVIIPLMQGSVGAVNYYTSPDVLLPLVSSVGAYVYLD